MIDSYIKRVLVFLLVTVAMVLMIACSSDSSTNPPEQLTLADAWKEFEDGDYTSAIVIFHTVLSDDSTLTEGYIGLGWSFAFDYRLDSAEVYLDIAIDLNSMSVDALALLGAVQLAHNDREGAISNALLALYQNPNWSFDHYSGIDYLDLHLILAEAYFGQGESSFALAQVQVDLLDPGNGLDPDDPNTWDGHTSYAAALLMAIQKIEEDVGLDLLL